jgi:hypothetical protein
MWISTSSALPITRGHEWTGRESEPVLATDGKRYNVCTLRVEHWAGDDEPECFWQIEGRDAYRMDGVLAWMEIPAW